MFFLRLSSVSCLHCYRKKNSGRCKLCILECAGSLLCFFILCSTICVKFLEKYGLISSLRPLQANSLNSLKMSFFTFIVSLDKLVYTINLTLTFCILQHRPVYG